MLPTLLQQGRVLYYSGYMNSFNSLLFSRRSRRIFLDRPVEEEKIGELIEAALASPTSRNLEPCVFIVISDKDRLAALSEVKPHGASFVAGAPLAIAVAADTEKSDVWIEDASIASIDIQMAAEALGLASCWVQIRRRKTSAGEASSRAAADLLNLPGNFEVLSLIAIGYSEEKREARTAGELSRNHVYREQFGTDYSS